MAPVSKKASGPKKGPGKQKLKGKGGGKKNKLSLKFTIDCTHPVEDGIMNSQDFEKQFEDCTFRPQIGNNSRQLSMKRSFSKEEKPWMAPAPGSKGDSAKSVKSCASQQQLAERMQFSIQKDIQRKRMAQHQKQVKNAVIAHGGWPKDYEGGGQALPPSEQEQAAKKPLFKRYDGKAPARGASGKQSTRSVVGAQKRPRAR